MHPRGNACSRGRGSTPATTWPARHARSSPRYAGKATRPCGASRRASTRCPGSGSPRCRSRRRNSRPRATHSRRMRSQPSNAPSPTSRRSMRRSAPRHCRSRRCLACAASACCGRFPPSACTYPPARPRCPRPSSCWRRRRGSRAARNACCARRRTAKGVQTRPCWWPRGCAASTRCSGSGGRKPSPRSPSARSRCRRSTRSSGRAMPGSRRPSRSSRPTRRAPRSTFPRDPPKCWSSPMTARGPISSPPTCSRRPNTTRCRRPCC